MTSSCVTACQYNVGTPWRSFFFFYLSVFLGTSETERHSVWIVRKPDKKYVSQSSCRTTNRQENRLFRRKALYRCRIIMIILIIMILCRRRHYYVFTHIPTVEITHLHYPGPARNIDSDFFNFSTHCKGAVIKCALLHEKVLHGNK